MVAYLRALRAGVRKPPRKEPAGAGGTLRSRPPLWASGSGATDRDHDLAIAEQRSKLDDMDCERRLSIPHSAVIPPSTNSRAPVT